MLSPHTAPAAATAMITTRFRPPVPATTPAAMTAVSLGTIGMIESSRANRKMKGYVHHASEMRSISESSMVVKRAGVGAHRTGLVLVYPVSGDVRQGNLDIHLVAHRR